MGESEVKKERDSSLAFLQFLVLILIPDICLQQLTVPALSNPPTGILTIRIGNYSHQVYNYEFLIVLSTL